MRLMSQSLGTTQNGILTIGGVSVPDLAKEYGTPLFILDEGYIRTACRAFNNTLKKHYDGNVMIAYASKAMSFTALYRLLEEEGMAADVVSGGELFTAMRAGFPAGKIFFHGNNKTAAELEYALQCGVYRFVVDNREELSLLDRIAGRMGKTADISFRIKPGIDAHTHEFITTGKIDSKFGVALENGEALDIVRESLTLKNVNLKGVHCHIGSQIFDTEPFELAVKVLMQFLSDIKRELGYTISELNLGGGFGIQYIESHDPPELAVVAETIAHAVTKCSAELGIPLPDLVLEPGRSIIAPSGITVYTIGSVKEIPGICNYVAVDGGMTDNPRYALYGAIYNAILPERANDECTTTVTIAGRCCESGDLISKDVALPAAHAGELLAVLATGAYNYSMASNYNRLPKPPVVMVADGTYRLVVRRETYDDIVKCDV